MESTEPANVRSDDSALDLPPPATSAQVLFVYRAMLARVVVPARFAGKLIDAFVVISAMAVIFLVTKGIVSAANLSVTERTLLATSLSLGVGGLAVAAIYRRHRRDD